MLTTRQFASRLNRLERLVVMFYYCEELTIAEVAAVLNRTPQECSATLQAVIERAHAELGGTLRNNIKLKPKSFNLAADAAVRKLSQQEVFTTGNIAEIFGVAPRTVSKWIDSGLLKGWRIPGSKDRRVSRAALDQFATECQLPQWPPGGGSDDEPDPWEPPPAAEAALGEDELKAA